MRLQCRVADTVFSSHRSFSACYHRCGCLLLAESLCNTPNRPTPKVKNQLTNARHTVIAHRRWIYLHPKGQRHAIISFEHRRQLDRCCADLDRRPGARPRQLFSACSVIRPYGVLYVLLWSLRGVRAGGT
ncbi:hypothetical protein BRADI_1g71333v3 [Brachypodium distachyon]|uniref:Uncharacterized protein n=1 Tax=Brachypodium distachyon TaxID=15368 RepID=A0A0Q3KF87_BRADI|nr:hypothetical protein BRADI_1g71333v3 [Brachypodium distachyon]